MEVKIAVAGPMTGPDAPFGEQLVRGAQAAADHINRSGDRRVKIALIQGDDAGQPERAKALAQKLVEQEKVNYIIGHFNSSCTLAASEVYDSPKALNVTPASTIEKVTDRGLPTVLRMCGVNDRQGDRIAHFVSKCHEHPKAVLIDDRRPYGESLAEFTQDQLKKRNIQLVHQESINRGDRDFSGLVDRIREKNGNVVIFTGMAAEAGPMVRQIREKGLKDLIFVCGDGNATSELPSFAGGNEYTKGIYMAFSTDIREAEREAVEAIRKNGYEPEGYTLNAYAAVQTIATGVEKVGGEAASSMRGAEEVSRWLKKNTVKTALGKVEFHDSGDMRGVEYDMYKWDEKGHWHRMK